MTNLYSIEMKVSAIAVIRAESAEEALAIAQGESNMHINVKTAGASDVPVSDQAYNDPRLPRVSLAREMTVHGPWDGATPVEICEYAVMPADQDPATGQNDNEAIPIAVSR